MEEELRLNDIADDLLILNKMTIDTLFKLDNCVDCIALYLFYYKTAKWQKTNTIKANDMYVKKSLKWGSEKIKRTKNILKEHGLINIVQRRNNGKIEGWYVEISYLVTQKKTEDIKIKVQEAKNSQSSVVEGLSNNSRNQQLANPTSGFEDINALKENIKCLKKEIEMLKNNKKENKKESKKFMPPTLEEIQAYCLKRNNKVNPITFYDYYEAGNWIDAKGNKIKNWKQKIITWEKHQQPQNNNNNKKENGWDYINQEFEKAYMPF